VAGTVCQALPRNWLSHLGRHSSRLHRTLHGRERNLTFLHELHHIGLVHVMHIVLVDLKPASKEITEALQDVGSQYNGARQVMRCQSTERPMRWMTWQAIAREYAACHVMGCHLTQEYMCWMTWQPRNQSDVARHIMGCHSIRETMRGGEHSLVPTRVALAFSLSSVSIAAACEVAKPVPAVAEASETAQRKWRTAVRRWRLGDCRETAWISSASAN
jgi:hypothetical protein